MTQKSPSVEEILKMPLRGCDIVGELRENKGIGVDVVEYEELIKSIKGVFNG